MKDWAASIDLRLLNKGGAITCVRWQDESIVDLSWASPTMVRKIADWKIIEDAETLSETRKKEGSIFNSKMANQDT